MYLSTWSCQHTCFLYFGCIYCQPAPPNDDLKETIHSSHFSVKNEGCVIKNSHRFFSQYFRQGRPLNQVILMVMLTEKSKIKSIARRVRSSHILGVWIPDYTQTRVPYNLLYILLSYLNRCSLSSTVQLSCLPKQMFSILYCSVVLPT